MIQFENVYKTFEQGGSALEDVNFQLAKGEMAFLTGHSGAGKTTLLKLILMIERQTRGQIFIDNQNISRLPALRIPYFRRKIGMIFQHPLLLKNRSVFENVSVPLVISAYRPNEIKRRVHAALDKVGLLSREKCLPISLSAGEQQRVSIARAIVNKPDIVIADEPTGNLDPSLSAEIMSLFEAFNQVGVTILVASHNISLVAQLGHRVLTLENGHLRGDICAG